MVTNEISDEEKLKIINSTFGSDIELDGLEDKIIENANIDHKHYLLIYTNIAFFPVDDLDEYIEMCLNDCCDPKGLTNDIELEFGAITIIPRLYDETYIVSDNERVANYAKKWINENYPNKEVFIAEDENAVPPDPLKIVEPSEKLIANNTVKPYIEKPRNYTNNSFMVIANLDTGDDKTTTTTKEQADAIKFLTTHKVIIVDTIEEKKKLPDNIAIIIGDKTSDYIQTEADLARMNYSTTYLLLNFEIKTHHPNLFKEVIRATQYYIQDRYGDNGIKFHINIIDSPEDADNPENVYFELDMKSNIPTTTIHNDILSYIGSYCLNIEFEYNRKR